MTLPFDDWADIYDQVYAYLDQDIPFYVEQAVSSGGPVLELGCGTGRVSLEIAAGGIDVTGVDLSPRMLEVAGRKAQVQGLSAHCDFQQGDMREVRLEQRFPLVIIPFRGFQHLETVVDQREALATVRNHLAPGGLLIVDMFNPDVAMLADMDSTPFHVRDVHQPESGTRLVVYGQNRWDHIEQTNNSRLIIEEVDHQGRMLQRLYRDFVMRYTYRYEMQHLLEICGFTVEALYGDFDGNPVSEAAEELVWLSRARPGPTYLGGIGGGLC
jgi:SAM-dependent methyltransferase